MGGDWR